MDRIESYEEYKAYIKQASALSDKVTNCYLLPGAVKAMIEKGKLYYLAVPNGSLLLEREDGFYRAYYFLSLSAPAARLVLDRPAVIEFVFQNKLSEAQRLEIALLEAMGFSLGRESVRMVVKPDELIHVTDTSTVEVVKHGDEKILKDFFDATFNPLYSYIPTLRELTQAVDDQMLFCIYDGSQPCAGLYAQKDRGTATIRLLAVRPEYRKMGFGKRLVEGYHEAFVKEAGQFQLWVDLANTNAIHLYESFGYRFDIRKANEYVLK